MGNNQSNMPVPRKAIRVLVTAAVVVVGLVLAWNVYARNVDHPWTRDGQVRADVINITSYVSGKIVKVHVRDEELVNEGQLLFEVDPGSYQLAVDQAAVALDQAREEVQSLEAAVKSARASVDVARHNVQSAKAQIVSARAQVELAEAEQKRYARLAKSGAGSTEYAEKAQAQYVAAQSSLTVAQNAQSQAESQLASAIANLAKAEATLGVPSEGNVRIRAAKVALDTAKLNLERTRIVAPRTGWVTNLFLQPGSYVQPGQAMITLVEKESLRVSAFFKETQIFHIKPGDRAVVTLMGLSDRPLRPRGWPPSTRRVSPYAATPGRGAR
jgi:multidrug resistance efflux pump